MHCLQCGLKWSNVVTFFNYFFYFWTAVSDKAFFFFSKKAAVVGVTWGTLKMSDKNLYSQLRIYNSVHVVPNICLRASLRNLTTSPKPTRSHQIFGLQGDLGLLEVHAITTRHAPPRPPSSLLPLIPFPSGPVSWHTPTPAPPVNTLWLQGSVFPNLCNCVTHSTYTHTHKLKELGRVSGSAQPRFIRSK